MKLAEFINVLVPVLVVAPRRDVAFSVDITLLGALLFGTQLTVFDIIVPCGLFDF